MLKKKHLMEVFHVSKNSPETVFYEILCKKSFTVYPYIKKSFKISQYSQEYTCSFNKVADRQACNFIKKRLRHRCFLVNIAKILSNRASILKNVCERQLLKSEESKMKLEKADVLQKRCSQIFNKTLLRRNL